MMGPHLALAAVVGVACLALPACTGGTTPDCSDAQCGVVPEADIDVASDANPPTDGGGTDGG